MRTSLFPPSPDCPIAPEARKSTYARTLHRACLILGSVEALATYLQVPAADVKRWLEGEQPPEPIFLGAVDVILLNLDASGRGT